MILMRPFCRRKAASKNWSGSNHKASKGTETKFPCLPGVAGNITNLPDQCSQRLWPFFGPQWAP